jgi:hypothetical protein
MLWNVGIPVYLCEWYGHKVLYKDQTHIPQVSFDATSQGNVAMVIYEWADAPYLGKVTSMTDDSLPVREFLS